MLRLAHINFELDAKKKSGDELGCQKIIQGGVNDLHTNDTRMLVHKSVYVIVCYPRTPPLVFSILGDEDRMLTKMVSRVARGECISGPVVLALMNVLGAYRPHAIAVFPTDGKGDDGNEISPIVHVVHT